MYLKYLNVSRTYRIVNAVGIEISRAKARILSINRRNLYATCISINHKRLYDHFDCLLCGLMQAFDIL